MWLFSGETFRSEKQRRRKECFRSFLLRKTDFPLLVEASTDVMFEGVGGFALHWPSKKWLNYKVPMGTVHSLVNHTPTHSLMGSGVTAL